MEVFGDMCNLSDGVYLDGVQKGIMQGKAEGIMQGKTQGRVELIKKFIQKGNTLESALDMFDITDKDEIESLKKLVVN